VLTDAEVDRRFTTLVADLNSVTTTVDWALVTEPAERPSPDELATPEVQVGGDAPAQAAGSDASTASEHPDPREASDAGIVGLRVLAVGVALAMCALGLVLARTLDLGVVLIVLWYVLLVPGVTLGSLMVVDRLRS
jgi:hypothetical protein